MTEAELHELVEELLEPALDGTYLEAATLLNEELTERGWQVEWVDCGDHVHVVARNKELFPGDEFDFKFAPSPESILESGGW